MNDTSTSGDFDDSHLPSIEELLEEAERKVDPFRPYFFEPTESEFSRLRELAVGKGYRIRGPFDPGPGGVNAVWLEWTDNALARQAIEGASEQYFKGRTNLPAALEYFDGDLTGAPEISAIGMRRNPQRDPWAEYKTEAQRLTRGKSRFIPPKRIPELQARSAALWQRVAWGTKRLLEQPDLEPWLRVVDIEITNTNNKLQNANIHVERSAINIQWRFIVKRHISDGAEAPRILDALKRLFVLGGTEDVFARAQLSGLALILHEREPIIERLVEVRNVLDIVEPLLNAAVLGRPVLREDEFKEMQAKTEKRRRGNPKLQPPPEETINEVRRFVQDLLRDNPDMARTKAGAAWSERLKGEVMEEFGLGSTSGARGWLERAFPSGLPTT